MKCKMVIVLLITTLMISTVFGTVSSFETTIGVSSFEGDLGEAVDNTYLTWTTGGDADWTYDTSEYYYGGDSAKSGYISEVGYPEPKTSWISTTVEGPGKLYFCWKCIADSPYNSYIHFYIDGNYQYSMMGSQGWDECQENIPDGFHELKWIYEKDSSCDTTAWLDYVRFGQRPTRPTIHCEDGVDIGGYGKTYTFSFISEVSDEGDLYYEIDWGDGTTSGLVGPNASGTKFELTHAWIKPSPYFNTKDPYTISAKAIGADDGFESELGYFVIRMPRIVTIKDILHSFLERLPNSFPILMHLQKF